jgi:hypothetical protein
VGHPSDKILNLIFDFSKDFYNKCEAYKLGKQTKLPFCDSNSKSNEIFELIHSDVWGPSPIDSYNGFKYYVIFVDDFSRATWLYLMKNKSEVFFSFSKFCKPYRKPIQQRKLRFLEWTIEQNLSIKTLRILQTPTE